MTMQETHLQHMLVTLRTRLLVMCAATGLALDDACKALLESDMGRASAVIEGDASINALENEIDERTLSLLARTQPVARDLRFVVSALRLVIDLERIGDEAVSIAERTILMQGLSALPLLSQLGGLMETARGLYNDAVTALRENNKPLALRVSRSDEEATQLEVGIIQSVIQTPHVDPELAIHTILITRALNRVCRRAANIAEHVYFVLDGVSIKHKNISLS